MAIAETARLIASLELDPRKFTQGVNTATGSLGKLEGRFSKIGALASQGVSNAVTNIARIGIVAGGVIGVGVKQGLNSLAELESATNSADAAIKQMGLTGQVTSAQIAGWAQEIETAVGSAFDDKAITQAATTLIRFGKITTSNLRPALVVMTDLATKTGSVDSAASLLAKALADPEKAAGKLARSGVILTKVEQDQIKALVKAGDAAGAQKVLLDALSKATTGAAAASQGPYQRSLSVLKDITEDAERALATGFLPVIERVRDILSRELAKPETLNRIRDLGKSLAGGLDKLVDVVGKIPWSQVGDAFKLVGQGSKAALDLFTGLPPWVQTAVLTGWGLNKLTGGALGGIVGELGKGLIKGVLGMNAGVVNINAGVVNGAGGGVPGVAGTTNGGLSGLSKLFLVGEAIGLIAAVNEVRDNIASGLTQQSTDIHTAVSAQINNASTTTGQLQQSLAGVEQGIEALSHDPIGNALLGDQLGELQKMRAELSSKLAALDDHSKADFRQSERDDATHAATTKQAIDRSRDATEAARIAIASRVANTTSKVGDLLRVESSGTSRIVGAIQRNRPIVNVAVNVAKGDTIRVTKNYQSGGNLRTGGQQEFG